MTTSVTIIMLTNNYDGLEIAEIANLKKCFVCFNCLIFLLLLLVFLFLKSIKFKRVLLTIPTHCTKSIFEYNLFYQAGMSTYFCK